MTKTVISDRVFEWNSDEQPYATWLPAKLTSVRFVNCKFIDVARKDQPT